MCPEPKLRLVKIEVSHKFHWAFHKAFFGTIIMTHNTHVNQRNTPTLISDQAEIKQIEIESVQTMCLDNVHSQSVWQFPGDKWQWHIIVPLLLVLDECPFTRALPHSKFPSLGQRRLGTAPGLASMQSYTIWPVELPIWQQGKCQQC